MSIALKFIHSVSFIYSLVILMINVAVVGAPGTSYCLLFHPLIAPHAVTFSRISAQSCLHRRERRRRYSSTLFCTLKAQYLLGLKDATLQALSPAFQLLKGLPLLAPLMSF